MCFEHPPQRFAVPQLLEVPHRQERRDLWVGMRLRVQEVPEIAGCVLLDVVHNHLGPSGAYLDRFGPYFAGNAAGGNLFYVRSRDYGSTFNPATRVNSQDNSAISSLEQKASSAGQRITEQAPSNV